MLKPITPAPDAMPAGEPRRTADEIAIRNSTSPDCQAKIRSRRRRRAGLGGSSSGAPGGAASGSVIARAAQGVEAAGQRDQAGEGHRHSAQGHQEDHPGRGPEPLVEVVA